MSYAMFITVTEVTKASAISFINRPIDLNSMTKKDGIQ